MSKRGSRRARQRRRGSGPQAYARPGATPKGPGGSLHELLQDHERSRWAEIDAATRQPHNLIVELLPLPEALEHPQYGPGVLEMMALARLGVTGQGAERECFTCGMAWKRTVPPAAILCVTLDPLGHGLVAGICRGCIARGELRERVTAGLVRDLGVDPATCRTVHAQGGNA